MAYLELGPLTNAAMQETTCKAPSECFLPSQCPFAIIF